MSTWRNLIDAWRAADKSDLAAWGICIFAVVYLTLTVGPVLLGWR